MGFCPDSTTFMTHFKNDGGNEAGTEVTFDHANGKFNMNLGMKMVQHDHLLGLKLNNAGILNMYVKWDQHHVCNHTCKASIGTQIDMCEVAKGKVSKFPVSFQMEMKY